MLYLLTSTRTPLVVALLALVCICQPRAQTASISCPVDTALVWTGCRGTLVKDGHTYTGEFLNNQFHGKGAYWFSDGDYFNGTFKNGLPDGWGVYVFASDDKRKGDRYVGDFHQGQAQGRGTTFFSHGRRLRRPIRGWLA